MGVRNKNAFIMPFRNEDNVLDKIYSKQIRDIKENSPQQGSINIIEQHRVERPFVI